MYDEVLDFFYLVLVVAAGFALFYWIKSLFASARLKEWKNLAGKLGYRFGRPPNFSRKCLYGTYKGMHFIVFDAIYEEARGNHSNTSHETVFKVSLRRNRLPGLSLERRRPRDILDETFGTLTVKLDDPSFDRQYVLSGLDEDEGPLRRLFDDDLRRFLVSFSGGLRFRRIAADGHDLYVDFRPRIKPEELPKHLEAVHSLYRALTKRDRRQQAAQAPPDSPPEAKD